jgi:hypothetical protein
MISELTWYQFSNLPNINKLPQHEQERQYRIYLNEITMERFALIQEQMSKAEAMAVAASNGGGGGYIQQQEGTGCIELVFQTTDGTDVHFEVETSALTNYTISWGDGTEDIGEIDGGITIEHEYADSNTEYTARLCFDDASLVTELDLED